MLIDATHAEETRVVVVDGNKVEEFDFESENKRQLAGNIYLAKVTRVEPSLQAAFVDYGGNRHGFLAFSEIHPDYYQIPVADREALMEEERAYAEAMRARDEEEESKPSRGSRSRSRKSSRTKAAKANAGDAVETKEVTPQDNGDDASTQAAEKDSPKKAEIAGMETIDLDAEDGAADDKLAEVPEGTSPMETVAETPVEEPDGDDQNDAEATSTEEAAGDDAAADAETAEDAGADNGDVVDKAEPAEQDESDDKDEDDKEDTAKSDATSKDETIESVADEDDSEDIRPPRKPRPRRYKIQEVIKVRQVLLVQVVKEERGNKGAALTTYLSLAGRYCVLMPNTARGGGISRKITNAADRKKLKEIANEIQVPKGAGLIVRTAGAQRTKAEIKRDYEYLQRLWEQIRDLTLKSIAPVKIYEEGDLIKRSIRDLYNKDIDEVLVEGEGGYRIAKDFMKMIMPSHAKNVKQYADALPLFARYQVESYLGSMFNPTVQLRSGGYIVIGVTEALVAIDVNSGRATKEGSIEETALKTNLEAAEEVARQLRLRDLAGLIVIDFIDMDERKNNAAVEKRFKDRLKTDRARIQVGRISGFGLMEMSRQRLRPGMLEATTQPCNHCHGTGLIRSDDNLALTILRQIEEEGVRGRSREVLVKAPIAIMNFLMNQKREHITQIEARYGISVRVEGDPFLISPDFAIEKFKTATRPVSEPAALVVSADAALMAEVDEPEVEAEAEEAEEQQPKRKRRRRRRRKGGGDRAEQNGEAQAEAGAEGEAPEAQEGNAAEADIPAAEETAEKPKRKRTRRKKSDVAEEDAAVVAAEAGDAAETVTAEPEADAEKAEEKPKRKPRSRKKKEEPVAADPADAAEAAPEGAAEQSDAEEKPKKTRVRKPRAKKVDAVEEEPVAAAVPVAEATPEPVAEPAPEPAPAPTPEPAPEPEPALETASAAPEEPAKPKRKGWWSLGR